MNEDFHRIRRLPPYVFAHIDPIKAKARASGVDIIDLGTNTAMLLELGTPFCQLAASLQLLVELLPPFQEGAPVTESVKYPPDVPKVYI